MSRSLCLALIAHAGSSAASGLDLSNWLGQLGPVVGNATLFDLSLPGTHNSLSYDLSTTLSEGYEGMGSVISWIVHTFTPAIAGPFIRDQGQTQGISVTAQLDAGVRFLDFRIMYTQGPGKIIGSKDWYSLHGCESRHTAISYLKEIRTWLDAHPKEILVMTMSRHMSLSKKGTDAFPNTKPSDRQAFFEEVKDVLGGLLFDSSQGLLNETSVATLWQRNQRVVLYIQDHSEFTKDSSLALDGARFIDNSGADAFSKGSKPPQALDVFRQGTQRRADHKADNRFYLLGMETSGGTTNVEMAALIRFLPFIQKDAHIKKCAETFNIEGMDKWCPMSVLMDAAQLTNYYVQRVLDVAYTEGQENLEVDFPHAVYLDSVDTDGLIRTGTRRNNPLGGKQAPKSDHETTGYAYSATVIGATLRRLCQGSSSGECKSLGDFVQKARVAHPLELWNDVQHGRLPSWPTSTNEVLV